MPDEKKFDPRQIAETPIVREKNRETDEIKWPLPKQVFTRNPKVSDPKLETDEIPGIAREKNATSENLVAQEKIKAEKGAEKRKKANRK